MNLSLQESLLSPKGFDPLTHIPPQYDIYGHLKQNKSFQSKDINFMHTAKNTCMKVPWKEAVKGEADSMTQSKLFESRRQARIPDISYDLDKDGHVGFRDYFISKRYDIDNDGKLNEKEKAAAYEGLRNNIEANFRWNVDAQGIARPFRILQKRGVIVDADDFLPIQNTYPEHPSKKYIPHVSTYTELKNLRIKEMKDAINEKIKQRDLSNSNPIMPNDDSNSNKRKEQKRCPSHQSIKEIKSRMHKDARTKCGLTEKETDIKNTSRDPTLAYISEPKHKTISDIKEDLNNRDREEVKKLANNNENYKDDTARLNEREEEIFSKIYNKEDSKTFTKIKEQRKKDILNYNLKVFSNKTIGIHGHELPKFSHSLSQSTIDFWKRSDEYKESPKIISHVELKENMKYWKKPEDLLLSENREYAYVTDPYQRTHEKKEIKDSLVIKVNQINVFQGFDPNNPKPANSNMEHNLNSYRWTTLVHQFASSKFRKGRFFDSISQNDSKQSKTKLNSMHNLSPDLGIFDKKNKEDRKKLESHLPSEIEFKTLKDALYQKFAMNASKSEANMLQMKTGPIKTKAF